MKICIIGPGILSIPPKGWGAVEILIDDYRKNLQKLGHEVLIVNTKIREQIIAITNALNPDFVHVQYDEFISIVPHLRCKNVAITSHYGYLEQSNRWDPGYQSIFWQFVNSTANIFCLSPGIKEVYKRGSIAEDRLFVVPNGVRNDLFEFRETTKYTDRTMYLAKVDFRKRQYILQDVPSLYFAGNLADDRFNHTSPRYLGEWSKARLYENLTDYPNLALLSDGEAHPLVCMEAMSAGLGLVLSEPSVANLDLDLPFIDVIPNDKLEDIAYIESVLKENRQKSIEMRKEIREYVIENFAWENIVKNYYLPAVNAVANKGSSQ